MLPSPQATPLLTDAWFSALPERMQEALMGVAQFREAGACQRIITRGEAHCGIFCLLHGGAVVYSESEPGRTDVLSRLDPPTWFGEVGLFDGRAHTHTVDTEIPSKWLFFPRTLLLAMLKDEPSYWQHLSLLLTAKLRLTFFILDDIAVVPSEVRLARRLVVKAAGLGASNAYSPNIRISQDQLAQATGIGRSTLNPILRNWSERGLIQVAYGGLVIRDLDALKSLARFDEWPQSYKDTLASSVANPPALPFG